MNTFSSFTTMVATASIHAITFPHISGYRISERIYQGNRTAVYRAHQIASDQSVVIKVLKASHPCFSDLAQFRHQYTITKSLSIPGIAKPLSLETWDNSYALVMEDFKGVSLQQYKQTHTLSITETLSIAIQMADVLGDLFEHQIIHKDIKPANIIIEPNSKRIQLIDFSIASVLPKAASKEAAQKTQDIQSSTKLEGTLAYLSPEQTGRMNRGIDYRTDFYGLGITLYELFAGVLPFQATDPMELVHCHIAQIPQSPGQINSDLPPVLSEIVLKLIAKNAEDRYQSAAGLKADLENCLTQWKETQTITDFKLAQQDSTGHFLIPEKLYGRQVEVQTLLQAFDRVSKPVAKSSEGEPSEVKASENATSTQAETTVCNQAEIVLVSGSSGMGKTSIIHEIHKPITRQKGYFIEGKFDQFNRNIPLLAFVQAMQSLIDQLLSESDQQLNQWRGKILAALGEEGQVLTEVIPTLESIIGPQPSVPELSGNAAQNRFNRLFQKFIAVFTTTAHPLVLFVDDLQWADSASLQLITRLMENAQHLLLLCAYRDNEVSSAHPFILMVEALRAAKTKISTIHLNPLEPVHVGQIVSDTLHCTQARSQPLSQLIFQKTQGNPFFTTQFFKALQEENSITFNTHKNQWDWDIDQITASALNEDVVTFVAGQIQKLPAAAQESLKLAACIGNQFDLKTLSIVSEQSIEQTSAALWQAVEAGFVLANNSQPHNQVHNQAQNQIHNQVHEQAQGIHDDTESTDKIIYRFFHDRVQQAAYSIIPDKQKQATHYSIGQLLLSQLSPADQEERIFELTNHLNQGIALITDQSERDELAQLNLTACRRARTSIAYLTGQTYAQIGIQLLGAQAWQKQYDNALTLYNLAAELAWFCSDYEQMEQAFSAVVEQSHNSFDQIDVYRIKTRATTSKNEPTEALKIGLEILSRLGITFPQSPTPPDIQQAMLSVNELLGDRTIASLVDIPITAESEQIAIIDMIMDVAPAAYLSGSPLYPLLIAAAVQRSIQYGNTERSPHSYASYGMLMCYIAKAIDAGTAYGQLAQQLLTKVKTPTAKPDTLVVAGMFLTHRNQHIKASVSVLKAAYSAAIEVGNLEATGYAAAVVCSNAYWSAKPLGNLAREMSAYTEELEKLKLLTTANWCRIYQQAILNLSSFLTAEGSEEDSEEYSEKRPSQLHVLSGEAFVETEFLSSLQSGQDLIALYFFYLNKLVLSYLFGEFDATQAYAIEVRQYLGILPGVVEEAVFYFYDALAAIATFSDTFCDASQSFSLEIDIENLTERQAEILTQVEANQTQLQQTWANHAPMNHQHKVDLIEAEKCRVLGKKASAIELYDQAIAGAKNNGYSQEAALANELAAKFYLDWGKDKVAAGYMQSAYYDYARWGANAKIGQLETRYPQLLATIINSYTDLLALQTAQPDSHLLTARETFSTVTSSRSRSRSSSHSRTRSSIKGTHTTQSLLLDLPAVMKAAQAISQEIGLESLLSKLMQILIVNAGAQTGHFVGYQDNQWIVMVKAEQAEAQPVSEILKTELDRYGDLPRSVVYRVARTQESAVFANLSAETQFLSDTYVNNRQPKSALCLPIIHQSQLVGILYLENNLSSNVFTRDRIEILQLLTAQAAISLENARLYQQTQNYSQTLEVEVANQTQALQQKAKDLETALKDLKQTQAHLVHTAKMSSLGQTVAGVAHEINNPINFIKGNIKHTKRAIGDLINLIDLYHEKYPQPDPEIEDLREDIDLEFLVDDAINGLDSMAVGSDRISQIVLSLRNFSRLDEVGIKAGDIHTGLESTLLLLNNQLHKHQLKNRIRIVKSYGELPPVVCDHSQLNQVFLNILNNAVDAIHTQFQSEQDQSKQDNTKMAEIHIYTNTLENEQQERDRVQITIANTDSYIAPEAQEKIFDPFFTTKAVGQGAGLGLFISYSVIKQHKGELNVSSQAEGKTEFIITLPVKSFS